MYVCMYVNVCLLIIAYRIAYICIQDAYVIYTLLALVFKVKHCIGSDECYLACI